jgi:hypothetical protein
MPGKPKPIVSSSTSERASNYFDIVAHLNDDWRVIVNRTASSWILQRRVPTKEPAAPNPLRRRDPDAPDDAAWFGVAYCSLSRALIRAVIAQAIQITDDAAVVLHELPDTIGADPDPLDQLRADLRTSTIPGRPAKPRPKPERPPVRRPCRHCGEEFELAPSAMNKRFCSVSCTAAGAKSAAARRLARMAAGEAPRATAPTPTPDRIQRGGTSPSLGTTLSAMIRLKANAYRAQMEVA